VFLYQFEIFYVSYNNKHYKMIWWITCTNNAKNHVDIIMIKSYS